MSPSGMDSVPVFRVLRGDPEDADLAALVAVFTALASAAPPPAAPARSAWSPLVAPTWRTSALR
ncbi:acyl-CoA carboxylase subunit epsilon [Amycolatopsis sp. WAC 04169]|uniref:acyl-CoA carboxylase subunit epsilon n=1 Tax=Amycolatopsis sp. WAC 04169 TaxID=2203197 RepID=UPI000F79DD96|nr:acyl-CoA carboxylase subunit epsilon [Amycolatopsis sp. WAC 04169]RSN20357.1 acyl-CoA carboxylase subunit epsilon [Amycolatopsis sp. WAC 04169]